MRHRLFLPLIGLLIVPLLLAADLNRPGPLKQTTSGRFTVIYSPELESSVSPVASQMEYIMADIEHFFGVPTSRPLRIEILTFSDFTQTGMDPKRVRAFYNMQYTLVLNYGTTTARSSASTINETLLIHETVHAYVHLRDPMTFQKIPLWFHEGLAMYLMVRLSREAPPVHTAKVRVFSPLDSDPHNNGLQAVRYLVERRGDPSLGKVLDFVGQGESFENALRTVYDLASIAALQEELRRW